MMKRRASRLIYLSFIFALIGGAILLRYADPFFVNALRLIAFDNFQRLNPEPYDPNLPIRIVDIDEKSLSVIGQWPWPRTTVRDLLLALTSKGAAVVAFDVLFAEPDRTSLEAIVKQLPAPEAAAVTAAMAGRPSNDEQFAAALKDTPSVLSVVLGDGASTSVQEKAGFAFAGDDPRSFLMGFKGASRNLPEFEDAARGIGAFNWVADRDQIVRRVALMFKLDQTFVPSLAAEALRIAQGATSYLLKASNASGETAFGQSTGLNHIRIGDVEIPTDAGGGVYLKFRHFNKAAYIPAWKVLAGEVSQEEIEGRIILVGTSAPGLLDLRATPVDTAVPGIDIHAQLLEHLLTGKFLERPDYALALEEFVILVLGSMLAFALPRVSAKTAAAIGLLTIALVLMGGWAAFQYWRRLYRSIVSSPGSGLHDRRHHLLHLQCRGGTAQPDPQRLRPISCSRAGRAAGAIPGKARAGWGRARHDHPVQRRAGFYRNLRGLQGRPARPHLADEPAANPAHEHDRRSRRNHRQIHWRCGHGLLERTTKCSAA